MSGKGAAGAEGLYNLCAGGCGKPQAVDPRPYCKAFHVFGEIRVN